MQMKPTRLTTWWCTQRKAVNNYMLTDRSTNTHNAGQLQKACDGVNVRPIIVDVGDAVRRGLGRCGARHAAVRMVAFLLSGNCNNSIDYTYNKKTLLNTIHGNLIHLFDPMSIIASYLSISGGDRGYVRFK